MCNNKVQNGSHKALVDVTLECRYLEGDDVISKNVTIEMGKEVYIRGIGLSGRVSACDPITSNPENPKGNYQIPLAVYFAAFEATF